MDTIQSTREIGFWVKELDLKLGIDAFTPGMGTHGNWVQPIPLELFPMLPRLQSLTFRHFRAYPTLPDTRILKALSKLTQLQSFTVRVCAIAPATISALVSAFPSLKKTRIIRSLYLNNSDLDGIPVLPHLHQPSLLSLTIRDPGFNDSLCRWFLTTPTAHSLSSLTIQSEAYCGRIIANFLSSRINTSLEYLQLRDPGMHFGQYRRRAEADREEVWAAILPHLDISGMNQLRELKMGDLFNMHIVKFISLLPAPQNLQRLSFLLSFKKVEYLVNKEQKALDTLLGQQQEFSDLKDVCFTYRGPLARDVVMKKLSQVFKAVSSRGILRLEMDPRKLSVGEDPFNCSYDDDDWY